MNAYSTLAAAKRLQSAGLTRPHAEALTTELRAKPHHFGNEVRPDDLARVTRERDAARLLSEHGSERATILEGSLNRVAGQLEHMAARALRAENGLRAAEQRLARGGSPYRMPVAAVRFVGAIAA